MKKLNFKFAWPKESKKAQKAIDTLINDGYVFHSSLTISVEGIKRAFALEKKPTREE